MNVNNLIGKKIFHNKFGEGEITSIEEKVIWVHFPNSGKDVRFRLSEFADYLIFLDPEDKTIWQGKQRAEVEEKKKKEEHTEKILEPKESGQEEKLTLCTVTEEMSDKSNKDSAFFEDTESEVKESIEEQKDDILTQEQDTYLKVIKIEDLKDKRFYIPDYQRGYRWLDEAGEFVKDIQENKSDEYLLQPIVVKEITEEKQYKQRLSKDGDPVIVEEGKLAVSESEKLYELIDGQQRLTTLFLTLGACCETPEFEIYYENERKLDNKYIDIAKNIIEKKLPSKKEKKKFSEKLYKVARYIWYEDKTCRLAEEVFRSLNADKTELTSAELFKALMLSESDEKKRRFWADRLDEMEIRLNDEDLWRFMADNKYISNRIELILNLYAHGLNKELTHGSRNFYQERAESLDGKGQEKIFFDSRYAFLSLLNYMDFQKENKEPALTADDIGDAIFDIFETLCSWHRDYRTHNLIGYLIARKGQTYESRVKMVYELKEVSEKESFESFIKELYAKVEKEDLKEKSGKERWEISLISGDSATKPNVVSFTRHYKECYNILLLSNIVCAMKGRSFFDFSSLKDKYNFKRDNRIVWDIEHINPKKPDEKLLELQKEGRTYTDYLSGELNTSFEGREGWYFYHRNTIVSCLQELNDRSSEDSTNKEKVKDLIDKIKKEKEENGFCSCPDKKLNDEVSKLWKRYVQGIDPDNSFSNLALLSSDINRKYHNKPYGEKCLIVQHDDEAGHFIPTMTKRVFTAKKYVTAELWDIDAREKYIKDVNDLLQYVCDEASAGE